MNLFILDVFDDNKGELLAINEKIDESEVLWSEVKSTLI